MMQIPVIDKGHLYTFSCPAVLCLLFSTLMMTGCREEPASGMSSSSISKQFSEVKTGSNPALVRPRSLAAELRDIAGIVRTELGDQSIPAFSTKMTDSIALSLSSRMFMESDPQKLVPALNKIVFTDCNLVFDNNRNALASMFPHSALQTGKGSCLGISLVYLLIAEKLDWPLYGVIAPGHFFVRYTGPAGNINIESLKSGEFRNDEWYQTHFPISSGSWYTFDNLTTSQVAGVVSFNAANILRENGKYPAAIALYERAVKELPQWGEAWGNMGITCESMGEIEKSLAMFEKARQVEPSLKNLSKNIAALFLKQKQYGRAATEYELALKRSPNDADVLYGLAYATYCSRDFSRAADYARKALAEGANHADAQALLDKALTRNAN
jgi:regulator of sirC expression with transglutaminase-like and TPR domain